MATIKNQGGCPCPRCLVTLSDTSNMGTKRDMNFRQSKNQIRVDNLQYRAHVTSARKIIYENNYVVNSVAIDKILKPTSLVPTRVRTNGKRHFKTLTDNDVPD